MNRLQAVTRIQPCEICGKSDNCTRSDDGQVIWCGRISAGAVRQNNGSQYLHILDGQPDAIARLRVNSRPAMNVGQKPQTQPETYSKDWDKSARNAFNHPNAPLARQELSTSLGVSVEPLEQLGIGWFGRDRGWAFPERDAMGKVIGINRRMLNGEKRREPGSRAGLTFDPERWAELHEIPDIFLVEGASDTAAMLSMGFSVIGRPSNLGGIELLSNLLKSIPTDRRIVVVGERDRKRHELLPSATQRKHKTGCEKCSVCWPGWFGAIRTAEQLAENLNREISWTLPPEGSKDVREWFLNTCEGRAEHG